MLLRLACASLLLLLAGSLAGNWIALEKIQEGFDKYNDTRLDPTGELARRLIDQVQGEHDAVLLGDSHAELWRFPSERVLNLGIGGQTTTQIALRSEAYRGRLRGRLLIISGGSNDATSVGTNPGRKEEIVNAALASLASIVQDHQPSFQRIAVLTVPPIFRPPLKYRLAHLDAMREARREINRGIRRLAARRDLVLIDADQIMRRRMRSEALSADGLHYNDRAYRLLEDALESGTGQAVKNAE
jgi:lysophospholipase L1-like esterase